MTKLAGKQNLFLKRQVAYELVVKYLETMTTGFIKFDNTILYVTKKIRKQHQGADIKRIFNEVTKTIDFQHITKDSLSDIVNQLLQSTN